MRVRKRVRCNEVEVMLRRCQVIDEELVSWEVAEIS
jgi:hypothetical protein